MISLIIHGIFPCIQSLILLCLFSTSSLRFPLSLVASLRPSSATMVVSLITPLSPSPPLMGFNSRCLAHILLGMARLSV